MSRNSDYFDSWAVFCTTTVMIRYIQRIVECNQGSTIKRQQNIESCNGPYQNQVKLIDWRFNYLTASLFFIWFKLPLSKRTRNAPVQQIATLSSKQSSTIYKLHSNYDWLQNNMADEVRSDQTNRKRSVAWNSCCTSLKDSGSGSLFILDTRIGARCVQPYQQIN